VVFNAVDAALWVGFWASVGYLAGNHLTTIYTIYAPWAATRSIWPLRRPGHPRSDRPPPAAPPGFDAPVVHCSFSG
jgi:hypothetical protein